MATAVRRAVLVLLTCLGVLLMHGAASAAAPALTDHTAHAVPAHAHAGHAAHHQAPSAPDDGTQHGTQHHLLAPCVAALPGSARVAPVPAVVAEVPDPVVTERLHRPTAALPPDGAHAPPDLSALCVSRT